MQPVFMQPILYKSITESFVDQDNKYRRTDDNRHQ